MALPLLLVPVEPVAPGLPVMAVVDTAARRAARSLRSRYVTSAWTHCALCRLCRTNIMQYESTGNIAMYVEIRPIFFRTGQIQIELRDMA